MKRTLVALAASLASLGALSPAFAQSSAPAAASAPAAQTAASAPAASTREARTEERIAQLHASLKITPQQEEQWSRFADVMRENGRTMSDLYRQRIAQRDTMSALDDMKQYQQITQANADGTKRLVEAFEPLYASLSPEQKKLADTSFREEHGKARHAHPHRRPHAASAAPASTTKP
jgi:hypothetical protein